MWLSKNKIARGHFVDRLKKGLQSSCLSLNEASRAKWLRVTKVYNSAISRKVVEKNVSATVPKGNMGYDLYTFPNDCSFHLAAHKHTSMASHAIFL